MKTLVIRLTAPLQSYGDSVAAFGYRTTFLNPSKSAVVGMLGASLGYRRPDSRNQALNTLKLAVRVDQPGEVMTDFQTIHYEKDKSPKLSYRSYLQDAVFVVAIGSEQVGLMEQIKVALRHPRFSLYLGRRSNPPAGVLKINEDLLKTTDNQLKVNFNEGTPVTILEQLPWQAARWYQKKYRRSEYLAPLLADADLLPDQPNYLVKDRVGSFDERNRYYEYRAVAEKKVALKNNSASEHDIWSWV